LGVLALALLAVTALGACATRNPAPDRTGPVDAGDAEGEPLFCPLDTDTCPRGCKPITGLGFDANYCHIVPGQIPLGCYDPSAYFELTADFGCVKNAKTGRLVSLSTSTLVPRATSSKEWTSCSLEERGIVAGDGREREAGVDASDAAPGDAAPGDAASPDASDAGMHDAATDHSAADAADATAE